ncbi:MAG TPA: ankyrin repeat domain-containing protein [Promineifilum sp.]|nr:ankyrin repeat domain-containing protein [Promineifilum sp.]
MNNTEGLALPAEVVREFVIAGHFDLPRVQAMLAEEPRLLNAANEWGPGDTETAIQGAAHTGQAAIAEYLLARGAPLELCTAAMLGRRADVATFLAADADAIHSRGAHGIALLSHAAFSGDVGLVADLHSRGAREGASLALANAVAASHKGVVAWLLEYADPDLTWLNWQGKTALDVALDAGQTAIADLLRSYGAESGTPAGD